MTRWCKILTQAGMHTLGQSDSPLWKNWTSQPINLIALETGKKNGCAQVQTVVQVTCQCHTKRQRETDRKSTSVLKKRGREMEKCIQNSKEHVHRPLVFLISLCGIGRNLSNIGTWFLHLCRVIWSFDGFKPAMVLIMHTRTPHNKINQKTHQPTNQSIQKRDTKRGIIPWHDPPKKKPDPIQRNCRGCKGVSTMVNNS